MLIVTTKFTKKKAVLTVFGVGLVMVVLILLAGRDAEEAVQPLPQLTDNKQRVEYLRSLGWEVSPEPVETLQFLLPEELTEPYLSYNDLQKEQGFDLSQCCGKQVARFTYTVTNYPGRAEGVQANLYVCEDLPAAGDICCPGEGGFQRGLAFPNEEENSQ